MTERTAAKRWTIRVAQEFLIEAETADLALEIACVLERRTFQGIVPRDTRSVLAPIPDEDESK